MGFLLLASFSRILTRRARRGGQGESDDKKNLVSWLLGKTDTAATMNCLLLALGRSALLVMLVMLVIFALHIHPDYPFFPLRDRENGVLLVLAFMLSFRLYFDF